MLAEFINSGHYLGRADGKGHTALILAACNGRKDAVSPLLAAGCAPNQRNHAGQTPAMYAALFQRAEILEDLRRRGADMQARDAAGNSVQSLARGEFAPQR